MRIAWTALSSNRERLCGQWPRPSGKTRPGASTALLALSKTDRSGACIRLKSPIAVGSRLTVKWHREHFSAVARNCRSDGREFLLGVRREPAGSGIEPGAPPNENRSESRLEPAEPAPPSDVARKRGPLSSVGSMVIQGSPAPRNAPKQSPSPRVLPEQAPAYTALWRTMHRANICRDYLFPRANRDRIAAP
jgi:hypothetical protein